jgi:NACalpha-BTF3-like transcription factor
MREEAMSNPSLKRALEVEFQASNEENRDKVHRQRPDVDDVTITPSQAEGDRETIERSLGEGGDDNLGREGGGQGQVQPTPSQAEGER